MGTSPDMTQLCQFHPAVREWFARTLGEPTAIQAQAWSAIRAGRDTLISAPTGSGKTLAAFLAAIDHLVCEGERHPLADRTTVLYVSPLKALSHDIQRNLQLPLMGIRDALLENRRPDVEVRAWVRTGDTPAGERERMRRRPPHIVVTTPESLFILLTSASGRAMLRDVRTVIVDELHAMAGNKRGSHLSLSLARLAALTGARLQRIGLSATLQPLEEMAAFLTAGGDCEIVDAGHRRQRDMALEVPASPLAAVMANEVWEELYDRLAALSRAHRTTLIFVNTRRLCERAARHLAERLGEEAVTAHHGSLARSHRLQAEQRLKDGRLKALVATASLELGIDIGDVDLVCQLGSPRSLNAFLQRVGRSGHALGRLPKGRLFPLSRDDLVECAALLEAVGRGALDPVAIPPAPLDVLAQQIVAEVAARGECGERELADELLSAWPYRNLSRATFEQVIGMLATGYATRRGRRGAYLHRDRVNGRLRPRRGARMIAITNGGAIPDQFDYDVLLQPQGLRVGTVNEDFAFESMPGDIFQLGNTAYRILKVENGRVYVEDAGSAPPGLPFWFGEAPGRSEPLSQAVSRLRAGVAERLDGGGVQAACAWLMQAYALDEAPARQLASYLGAAQSALGVVPTRDRIVLERFFDEVGDMHLVLHSPYGSRINRAWGLALRKRFCRQFNFELQAAALEDSVVLSLGPTHSFVLEQVAGYLHSATVREVLTQALLDAPMFAARWRWNASVALAVQRMHNGKRRPAQFQRSDAEDLLALVFPDQLACAENLRGDRTIPDHPLVAQTIHDCLHEAMDIVGLERLLTRLEAGEVTVTARDLAGPSPLAQEVINARPYAFLDDGAQEERRTLNVRRGEHLDIADAAALGRLDTEAVARVRAEAWPAPRDAEELHDALVVLGFLTEAEGRRGPLARSDQGPARSWQALFDALVAQERAVRLQAPGGDLLWVARERLATLRQVLPEARPVPALNALTDDSAVADSDSALVEVLRSRLEGLGPITAEALALPLGMSVSRVQTALLRLENEGFVIQGRFDDGGPMQWCERRLMARIHGYTVRRMRAEVEPLTPQDYMRFLFDWQGLSEPPSGVDALAGVLEQLEGFAVPAVAWERDVLPARIADYSPLLLDQLLSTGRFTWLRLAPSRNAGERTRVRRQGHGVRSTPVALVERENVVDWRRLAMAGQSVPPALSEPAERVMAALTQQGALFFGDLIDATGLLRSQLEDTLSELIVSGQVSSDTFNGLRALIVPGSKRPRLNGSARRHRALNPGVDSAGRWVARPYAAAGAPGGHGLGDGDSARLSRVAWLLLRRYGVVFRKLLEREVVAPPWRELLYVMHRLEARGEIRGGRFVQQFSGEQFAHPAALAALKAASNRPKDGTTIAVSAADPLNLVGIVTPGTRLPAIAGNRLLYRDGLALAMRVAGTVRFFGNDMSEETQALARNRLLPAVSRPMHHRRRA